MTTAAPRLLPCDGAADASGWSRAGVPPSSSSTVRPLAAHQTPRQGPGKLGTERLTDTVACTDLSVQAHASPQASHRSRPAHPQGQAGVVVQLDRFDWELVDFVLTWQPYGGPREEDVMPLFGMTCERLHQRLRESVVRCHQFRRGVELRPACPHRPRQPCPGRPARAEVTTVACPGIWRNTHGRRTAAATGQGPAVKPVCGHRLRVDSRRLSTPAEQISKQATATRKARHAQHR
jgi:hypothetical protein